MQKCFNNAKWITCSQTKKGAAVCFYKQFDFSKKIKSARLVASAIGVYDVFVDGQKIDNLSLMPQPCFYHIRDLKGDKNFELKKTIFTRSVGSFFLHNRMYTLYNMGGQMIKLWENGETKMVE